MVTFLTFCVLLSRENLFESLAQSSMNRYHAFIPVSSTSSKNVTVFIWTVSQVAILKRCFIPIEPEKGFIVSAIQSNDFSISCQFYFFLCAISSRATSLPGKPHLFKHLLNCIDTNLIDLSLTLSCWNGIYYYTLIPIFWHKASLLMLSSNVRSIGRRENCLDFFFGAKESVFLKIFVNFRAKWYLNLSWTSKMELLRRRRTEDGGRSRHFTLHQFSLVFETDSAEPTSKFF